MASIPPNPAHHALGKSRRGKVDNEGNFQPGKSALPDFDPAEIAEKLDLYWPDGKGDKFLVGAHSGWSEWPKSMVLKEMREIPGRMIALRPRENETNSEADRVLLHTMKKRVINHVTPALAGHPAGVYDFQGQKLMVQNSPMQIEPADGDWSHIRRLIEDRLGPEQSRYFHSWMRVAVLSLRDGSPGNYQQGQALILAGGAGTAKSRLQHFIITPLLGGRSGNPKSYVFGKCDFNDEMIEAEHILMEDPPNSTVMKDRVYFGEAIKEIVVNDTQRLHPKGKAAFMASPFWRLSISVNDDPDKMRVLPPITPDMEDKVMIFRVESGHEIPTPDEHLDGTPVTDDDLDRRRAFRERIAAELPAYAYWLCNEWEIPEDIRGERFGVKHYHDESLRAEMFEDTKGNELLNIIDAAEFITDDGQSGVKLWDLSGEDLNASKVTGLWKERAITLESILTAEHESINQSTVATKAKNFFKHNNTTQVLPRLKSDAPDRVDKARTKSWKGWSIARPPLDLSE